MTNYKYIVYIRDENDIDYFIGAYKELCHAKDDINYFLKPYDVTINSVSEFTSSFNNFLYLDVELPNENCFLSVRCFRLENEVLKNIID